MRATVCGPLAFAVALVAGACGSTDEKPSSVPSAGGDSSSSGTSHTVGGSQPAGSAGVAHGGQGSAGTSSKAGSAQGGSAALAGSGSGGSTGGSGGGVIAITEPGTVTNDWDGFCTATLTTDYVVKDDFGKVLFTAKAGETYLLLNYPPVNGVKAAYLTSAGVFEFKIGSTDANGGYPFTSNCEPAQFLPVSYFAVFADVTVYAEAELTTQICQLKAGDHVVREPLVSAGYGAVNSSAAANVYEIFLNAFSPQCANAEHGFISAPTVALFGSNRVLVPFHVIDAEK